MNAFHMQWQAIPHMLVDINHLIFAPFDTKGGNDDHLSNTGSR